MTKKQQKRFAFYARIVALLKNHEATAAAAKREAQEILNIFKKNEQLISLSRKTLTVQELCKSHAVHKRIKINGMTESDEDTIYYFERNLSRAAFKDLFKILHLKEVAQVYNDLRVIAENDDLNACVVRVKHGKGGRAEVTLLVSDFEKFLEATEEGSGSEYQNCWVADQI